MRVDRILQSAGLCALFLVLSRSWCQQSALVSDTNGLPPPHTVENSERSAPAKAERTADPVVKDGTPFGGSAAPTGASTEPESLFDAVANPFRPVITTVEVHAIGSEADTTQPQPFAAGGQEIVVSAGTYGDVSRFLQLSPGVVASSDLSNEMMVRGGHPMENLFLVDGIEVPNINHLATLGTTGGFGPMIDSGLIQTVQLHTGAYDARYPERLSSVTEIRTLDEANRVRHLEADGGIQGFGGLAETTLQGGDLLVAAHRGLLNLLSNTTGFTGMPTYTNELSRFRRKQSSGNEFTLLNLSGWDSLNYTPCESDAEESTTIASQYSGWRETSGVEWQHVYSSNSFAVAGISDSEQVEHIRQQDQLIDPVNAVFHGAACATVEAKYPATPVYMEDSNDSFTTASYRFEWGKSLFALTAGSAAWLQRPDYQIDQPLGAYSPYSITPTRSDSTSFSSEFSTVETGSHAQFTARPLRSLTFSAGGRLQTFAFGSHTTVTPRASVQYRPFDSLAFRLSYATYGQMPPYVYLLAYPANRAMVPMRATHEVAALDFAALPSSTLHVEAYRKQYTDIPASTEYPSITLHDMVDMIGQQFVWLPMNSGGQGEAAGIELSDITRVDSRFSIRSSVSYSRAKFAGLDHILRPSNYDFPWIANLAGVERLDHGYDFAWRYAYTTGRPYTPLDRRDSLAQNRPIYDVSEMNTLRAPFYSRLDAQINKDVRIRGLHLELYGGAENLLNRHNFLAYVWLPRTTREKHNREAVEEIYQIPLFPNAGIRFIFH